jgi:hypothetical protein
VGAVQARPSGYAASFLRSIDVRDVLEERAGRSMALLCGELDALGVPYRTHVEIGPWLAGIGRLARELGCTRVVIGANPRDAMRDAALRFDQWLIRGALRGNGAGCTVVRGDEGAAAQIDARMGAGSAAHLP